MATDELDGAPTHVRASATVIRAHKTRWFNAWFVRHATRRLSGAFSEIWVRGATEVAQLARRGSLLIVANHTSWWDGLVSLYLTNRLLEADGYALMDARNLRRLRFFARVGAFGVDLDRPEDAAAGLRYAARLLAQPGRVVWVFPQGHEVAVHVRPLGFRPGAAAIARLRRDASVVPMGLRYEFGELELPRLFVSFGAALPAVSEVDAGCQAQEAAVTEQLERIERAITGGDPSAEGFDCTMRYREGWWARLAVRMLDMLAAPRGIEGGSTPRGERPLEQPGSVDHEAVPHQPKPRR